MEAVVRISIIDVKQVQDILTVLSEWLTDVDDANEDNPVAYDFYTRVGARWEKGKYEERFKELLTEVK
jgi:hypothetical protein